MLRPLAPLLIALVALAPAVACAVSASTQAGTGAPGTDGGSAGKPAQAGPGATPGAADPSANPGGVAAGGAGLSAGPQACVAALNDASTSLFGGRVLIRLPKGVELVQQNPFYAQAAARLPLPPAAPPGAGAGPDPGAPETGTDCAGLPAPLARSVGGAPPACVEAETAQASTGPMSITSGTSARRMLHDRLSLIHISGPTRPY